MRKNTEQDFWNKVDIQGPDDCWNWTESKDSAGYGQFKLQGNRFNAHKLAWMLTYGDTKGLNVLHSCHNKLCCNPSHLWLGTTAENIQDVDVAKLDWDKVRNIRSRYVKRGKENNARILAVENNVSYSLIGMIVRNEIWIENAG